MPGKQMQEMRGRAIEEIKAKRASTRANRLELIQNIESKRASRLISYVTATRRTLGAQIASDVIPHFREHLADIGKVEKIDLFLITRGGHTLTPHRLVGLLREFGKGLGVLIPYMAHSAGTMIALGADEIVMGPMAELGPVDPSVGNDFNPVLDPGDAPGGKLTIPRPRMPISVEDVSAYLTLAQERAGLSKRGSMVEAFKALTDRIHPLALGNITSPAHAHPPAHKETPFHAHESDY